MSETSKKFEVVASIAATDMLVYNYLMPVAIHPELSKLWIVRYARPHKTPRNSEFVIAESRFRPVRWMKYLWHCVRLGRRREVLAFVNFNPLPYGLIALLAGRICGKPVHLGFIGSDWFKNAKHGWGRPFVPLLRRADFFTATGDEMRREMIEWGFDPERIRVLIHAIDLEAFEVGDPDRAEFDFTFVGRLIPLKRVDTILDAFAEVAKTRPEARLCIVGGGPLEEELRQRAANHGLGESVTFAGQVQDVPAWLARSRSLIIASEHEGFPFVIVEAMCSGLVPVSTPVGTVGDVVEDDENGLYFPVGDSGALARVMERLLDDPELRRRLRAEALKMRERFSYDVALRVWTDWFGELRKRG